MELAYPWVALRDPLIFETQLTKELLPDHILAGIAVRALARMEGSDDILYELLDGSMRVAVVHLTFSDSVDATWPWTDIFPDFSAWASTRMSKDSEGMGQSH